MNLVNPSNPENPQDHWGQQHNEIILNVLTQYGQQIAQIEDEHAKQQFIVSAVQSASQGVAGDDPNAYFNMLPGYNGLLSQVDFNNYTAIIDCFPDRHPWTKDRLKDLFGMLTVLPLNTEDEVNQAIETVRSFESQILQGGSDVEPEMLAFTSITRYSLYGWFTLPPIPEVEARINWGGVASDAAGALVGGLLGAAAASTIYKCCVD